MFIRFASLRVDRDSGRELGVFHSAGVLKRSGHLSEVEVETLDELMRIYNDKLEVPDCYSDCTLRWKRKYEAICWFKTQSREFISHMWTVAKFLKSHGMPMRLLRTALPGRVLYEDEHQVAAVPFRRAREFKRWI
jgi:hypothetical protein